MGAVGTTTLGFESDSGFDDGLLRSKAGGAGLEMATDSADGVGGGGGGGIFLGDAAEG